MRFQLLTLLAIAIVVCGISVPKAQAAADVSAVVSQMESIIKQMEALKAEFATLASSIPKPAGAVLGAQSTPVFTMSLEPGETNDDIKKIQKLLATDPEIYPYGVASGMFGPKTEEAIKNLQGRFGLKQVGVVGPATKALLELFMNAYPDGNYPADVLKKKPAAVLGASVSVPTTPAAPSVPAVSVGGSAIDMISAKYDGSQAKVTIEYKDNTGNSFVVTGNTKIAIVDGVASKLGKTRADILSLIEFTGGSRSDDEDEDEDDEDYNIDLEIDDDEVQLSFEYDGDEYEVESDSTDEDDVLDEVADEIGEDLEDIDDDLLDAIEEALEEALDEEEDDDEGDSDEIESITARVRDGEAEIEVEYGDGEEEEFTVEETLEAKIIEEVADELNIDEDEVEDMIEFEYEPVDEIRVEIRDGEALAFVEFEDGTVKRIRINSEDEGDIIEAIAEELDEDEDDVEDWVEFE